MMTLDLIGWIARDSTTSVCCDGVWVMLQSDHGGHFPFQAFCDIDRWLEGILEW